MSLVVVLVSVQICIFPSFRWVEVGAWSNTQPLGHKWIYALNIQVRFVCCFTAFCWSPPLVTLLLGPSDSHYSYLWKIFCVQVYLVCTIISVGGQAYLKCTIFPVNLGKISPVANRYSIVGFWAVWVIIDFESFFSITVIGLTTLCSLWFEFSMIFAGFLLNFSLDYG